MIYKLSLLQLIHSYRLIQQELPGLKHVDQYYLHLKSFPTLMLRLSFALFYVS